MQRTLIFDIVALTAIFGFKLLASILVTRQRGQVVLCLAMLSSKQALQALCPQDNETGSFINSLLEENYRIGNENRKLKYREEELEGRRPRL